MSPLNARKARSGQAEPHGPKEKDKTSKERLKTIDSELGELKGEADVLRNRWLQEKQLIEKVKALKEEHEKLRKQIEQAQQAGDLQKAAEIQYDRLPKLETDIELATKKLEEEHTDSSLLRGEVTEEDRRAMTRYWLR